MEHVAKAHNHPPTYEKSSEFASLKAMKEVENKSKCQPGQVFLMTEILDDFSIVVYAFYSLDASQQSRRYVCFFDCAMD